jgi:hypothetical protein
MKAPGNMLRERGILDQVKAILSASRQVHVTGRGGRLAGCEEPDPARPGNCCRRIAKLARLQPADLAGGTIDPEQANLATRAGFSFHESEGSTNQLTWLARDGKHNSFGNIAWRG